MRRLAALALVLSTSGCMWSPANHSHKENTETIAISGWASGAGKTVLIKARNYDTDLIEVVGSAVSGATESPSGSGLYPWSVTSPALARKYWAPNGLGVTNRSIGRAELSAHQDSAQLLTFTEAAQGCAVNKLLAGETLSMAGQQCSDGNQVILHDNSGVNVASEPVSWTVVSSKVLGSPSVHVSVVKYNSDGSDVYGLVCAPTAGTTHKTVMYNHGGMWGLSEGESTWCLDWARNGWVWAMSAYRGETLRVPAAWGMGGTEWTSGGIVETSLGEVKDVLRLLQITRAQPTVNTSQVLMWGASHGGAITLRAIQSGALVNAAIALAPATDWAQIFNDCLGNPDPVCAAIVDTANPPASFLATEMGGTPATHPRSYAWRSPYSFPLDLAARKDVKVAIMHGIADATVHVKQACKLATSAWGTEFKAWHVPTATTAGAYSTAPVAGCEGITWTAAPRPTSSWPDNRYLLVYDGLTHALGTNITTDFLNLVLSLGW